MRHKTLKIRLARAWLCLFTVNIILTTMLTLTASAASTFSLSDIFIAGDCSTGTTEPPAFSSIQDNCSSVPSSTDSEEVWRIYDTSKAIVTALNNKAEYYNQLTSIVKGKVIKKYIK